jgi:hypothetical protein
VVRGRVEPNVTTSHVPFGDAQRDQAAPLCRVEREWLPVKFARQPSNRNVRADLGVPCQSHP